jgi:GT2 family glycosyltransferase
MATKVLDLDLAAWPTKIENLDGYKQALVLYRYRGRPVGRVWVSVQNGRINQLELQDAIAHSDNWPLWQTRMQEIVSWDGRLSTDQLPQATVAICTRDRPDDMARCLAELASLPDSGHELLVVDNAPATEATRELVKSYGGRVRYLREDRPGLNVARNRAIQEAQHDIIAFNDDDAVPDPGWLPALLRNFTDPDILCVTGLTMPLELETESQEWFERYSPFARGFNRVLHYGTRQAALTAGHVGAGANMALRRSVLQKVGPFDEALDAGTLTKSGGDTEMFARILLRGYHIVYDPSALSWHRHRRTWEELRYAAYGYGVGIYAFWTRMLLRERQLGVVRSAWWYFRYQQLPMLLGGLRKQADSVPLDIVLAELRGCLSGPRAYIRASRQVGEVL